MINLWAMEKAKRPTFIGLSLIYLIVLSFFQIFNISYIYAGEASGVSGDAEAYRAKGYQAQQLGDIDTAIEWYQKASNLRPEYAAPHNDLGILFETKGWLDRAEAEYQKALAIDPSYKEVHTNLALLYERKGELEKAAFHWMRRYKLGSFGDPWTEEAKIRLGKLGLIDKAEKDTVSAEPMVSAKEPTAEKAKPVEKKDLYYRTVKKKESPAAKAEKGNEWAKVGHDRYDKGARKVRISRAMDKELQESLRLAEERLRRERDSKGDVGIKKQIEPGAAVDAKVNAVGIKNQPDARMTATDSQMNAAYDRAREYYNKGEYSTALDIIRRAKQASSNNSSLVGLEDEIKFKMKEKRTEDHYKEGMIRYRKKDFAGARKEFEAILSILPE